MAIPVYRLRGFQMPVADSELFNQLLAYMGRRSTAETLQSDLAGLGVREGGLVRTRRTLQNRGDPLAMRILDLLRQSGVRAEPAFRVPRRGPRVFAPQLFASRPGLSSGSLPPGLPAGFPHPLAPYGVTVPPRGRPDLWRRR